MAMMIQTTKAVMPGDDGGLFRVSFWGTGTVSQTCIGIGVYTRSALGWRLDGCVYKMLVYHHYGGFVRRSCWAAIHAGLRLDSNSYWKLSVFYCRIADQVLRDVLKFAVLLRVVQLSKAAESAVQAGQMRVT
jgi:hypothetical protein